MNVFLWEALCAGAMGKASPSLLAEGRAMLSALIADVLRIDDCRVTTIAGNQQLAEELRTDDRVDVHIANDPESERSRFRQLAAECDRTWIIAPEIDGCLAGRTRLAQSVGGNVVGSTLDAIELTSDKLATARQLEACGIPTIETRLLDASADPTFSCVIKPRHGAGSMGVRLIDGTGQLFNPKMNGVAGAGRSAAEEAPAVACVASHRGFTPDGRSSPGHPTQSPPLISPGLVEETTVWRKAQDQVAADDYILQPFIDGTPLSIAALIDRERDSITTLPVATQRLSDDGTFTYLGGRIGDSSIVQPEAESIVRRVCDNIPGLAGYVGFDLILPDDNANDLLIVEINPRLTMSYVGYRRLTTVNLARRVLVPGDAAEEIEWLPMAVEFQATGQTATSDLLTLSPRHLVTPSPHSGR